MAAGVGFVAEDDVDGVCGVEGCEVEGGGWAEDEGGGGGEEGVCCCFWGER